jgi:hypothetical protein
MDTQLLGLICLLLDTHDGSRQFFFREWEPLVFVWGMLGFLIVHDLEKKTYTITRA